MQTRQHAAEFHMPDSVLEQVVFCDFDGTITEEETFVAVLREFAPEKAEVLIPRMYAMEISLRDGVRQILQGIPSERMGAVLDFVQGRKIRKGFEEFADFLKGRGIPLVVVSGGLRCIIEAIMGEALLKKVHKVYAVDLDLSGQFIEPISGYEDDLELVSKVRVMREFTTKETIAIGDSVTDLNMALHAELVFARDRLAKYLDERGKRYVEWKNFIDIRNFLAYHWRHDPH